MVARTQNDFLNHKTITLMVMLPLLIGIFLPWVMSEKSGLPYAVFENNEHLTTIPKFYLKLKPESKSIAYYKIVPINEDLEKVNWGIAMRHQGIPFGLHLPGLLQFKIQFANLRHEPTSVQVVSTFRVPNQVINDLVFKNKTCDSFIINLINLEDPKLSSYLKSELQQVLDFNQFHFFINGKEQKIIDKKNLTPHQIFVKLEASKEIGGKNLTASLASLKFKSEDFVIKCPN